MKSVVTFTEIILYNTKGMVITEGLKTFTQVIMDQLVPV